MKEKHKDILYLLIFAGFFIPVILAREGTLYFDISHSQLVFLDKFGFYEGGTANLDVTTNNYQANLTAYGCTDSGWRNLYLSYVSTQTLCANNRQEIADCHSTNIIGNGNLNFTATGGNGLTQTAMYYFAVLSCYNDELPCEVDFAFLNPGNQQLSSEYAPLPWFYGLFIFLWLPVIALWITNWISHRAQKNKLHRLITLFPISKLAWVTGACVFWTLASRYPYVEIAAVASYAILRLICQALLVLVFLLISRGWGIVDEKLKGDVIVIFAAIALLAATQVIGVLWGGLLKFLLLGSYAFVVFLIFAYSNQSILKLGDREERHTDNFLGPHLVGVDVVGKKISMLRKFNLIMMVFCIAQISIVGLDTLIFYNSAWFTQLLLEIIDYLVFISIASILHLRMDNVYYHLVGAGGDTSPQAKNRNKEKITWASVASSDEEESQPLSLNWERPETPIPGYAAL